MAIELEKFKILSDTMTKPDLGFFAIDRSRIEWINCRERFGGLLSSYTEGFYFSHHRNDSEQIIRFIWKTEEILQIEKSKFGKTNRPYATWIDLNFWRENFMKRSLLLILIRAGLNYDPGKENYEEALYGEPYLKETKIAVMRFLFGFTYCKSGNWNGWRSMFQHMSPTEVKKNLILPLDKNAEPSIIGTNTLWG